MCQRMFPKCILCCLACAHLLFALGCVEEHAANSSCELTVALVDADMGEALPGIVQICNAQGDSIEIAELINRSQGIESPGPLHKWWVLLQSTRLTVPARPLSIRALSGLETELATHEIDLTGKTEARLKLPLERFCRARSAGYLAGNTHLHLKKLSRTESDRYLREVPLADGLEIVFVSYLERAESDLEYTSNKYSPGDLERLSHGHVYLGHGEEHRHNFASQGEGYGHILLLDIPYIIQPVSIGPGITKRGSDAPPLQVGIDKARSLGGKVVWAHNLFGFEDIPNWITGRVHANNIYDGSHRGSFEDTYYRYLNVGLHVPFSTGTDWFIYDFSRVYVMSDRAVTPTEWLDLLAAGGTYITNGPLLEFTVNEQPIGATLELDGPRTVAVQAKALGRTDFTRLELVRNGQIVAHAPSRAEGQHYVAELQLEVSIDAPSWLAARTPPPPVPDRQNTSRDFPQNEFGGKLFSHTSPIYVHLAGQGVFDATVARGLLAEMQADWSEIEKQAVFASDAERKQVQAVYDEAIAKLQSQLDSEGK